MLRGKSRANGPARDPHGAPEPDPVRVDPGRCRGGDARTRPRSPATVHFHFGRVRHFIECWAAARGHLREITSRDVDAVLEPLRGHRRYNAITALRSLFRFARRRGLTFADPTRHLVGGRGAGRTMLPMSTRTKIISGDRGRGGGLLDRWPSALGGRGGRRSRYVQAPCLRPAQQCPKGAVAA